MNTRLFIPSSLALCAGFITGCGGSSQQQEASLPIGLQRTVIIQDIQINPANPNLPTVTYPFGFGIASKAHAIVYYSGTMGSTTPVNGASVHVENYVASDDHADKISFFWDKAYVILENVSNVTKGEGRATCSVRDDNMFINPPQTDRPGKIIDFSSTPQQ